MVQHEHRVQGPAYQSADLVPHLCIAVHKSAVILELLKKENVIRKNVIRKSLTQKCKSVALDGRVALTVNRPHGKPAVDDPAVPELVSDVLPAQSIVKCQIQSQHVAGM